MVKKTAKKTAVKRAKAKKTVAPTPKKQKKLKFSWAVRTWHLAPLATLGPVGYFPKGPGTMGSLAALPFIYLLSYGSSILLWLTIVVLFLLGLIAVKQFTENKTEKDPSCVIVDEVVGQMIPFVVVLPEFMHWPMLFV